MTAWRIVIRFLRPRETMAQIPVDPPAEPPVAPIRRDVPAGDAEIAAVAAARGLPILPECAPGVAANLALLARHARIMRGEPA
ncbi:AtzG-like protein [Novosphingobium resinovorum]|uniref:AtzG-like protein n=1 Tax=Novosphingobium resinovorum TaxID=158500 RepID=UPI002ED32685|nr:AtzG-like protein [Novosphingobium resinovorum]